MFLDQEKQIAKIDAGNVRAAISALPDQVETAWQDARWIRFPESYRKVSEVVVAGMGGSTLGADLIKSVYGGALRAPFSYVNGYKLPGSVGRNALVVLSSYSGTTEETLSCFREAKKRGAKIAGIASGGPLGKLLARANSPAYLFEPVHNPGNQPRMGLGYLTFGLLAMLERLGFVRVKASDVSSAIVGLRGLDRRWSVKRPQSKNPAKLFAKALQGTIPVLVGAEHLAANAHILQNQIHESPKEFCAAFPLPELNHHLMEGLKFPAGLARELTFVFLSSDLYSERLRLRMKITEEVVGKQGFGFVRFEAAESTRLGQALETLAFGSWVSFYMSMLNRVNPSVIPWVDFFKKRLRRG